MGKPTEKQVTCIYYINNNLGMDFHPQTFEEASDFISKYLLQSKQKKYSRARNQYTQKQRFGYLDGHEDADLCAMNGIFPWGNS